MRVLPAIFYLLFLVVNITHAQVSISIGEGTNKRQTNLQSIQIENEIIGHILIQKYKLVFYNDGDASTEGQLICPLPAGSKIVEYAMDVFGEKRAGVVVSATKALHAYENIVRQKTDPGIVEIDEENNLFKMRVFPIESHKTKTVWLTTMRMIENNQVDLALETFGSATTTKTTISISNVSAPPTAQGWKFTKTQKGSWTASMEGQKQALKPCLLNLQSLPVTLAWKEKGKTYTSIFWEDDSFFDIHLIKQPGDTTQLWWDGSIKANHKILDELQKWFIWRKSGKIELSIFRDSLEAKESFTVKDGKCDSLIQRLQKIKPHGMARPSVLPWNEPHNGVIIITDGQFPEGHQDIPENLTFPLFTILEKSNNNYLKDLSFLSQHHGFRNMGLTSMSYGKTSSHIICSGISRDLNIADEHNHKAAYWLWAHQYAKKLKAKSAPNSEISAFHTEHQVADTKHSWIVLENIHQHIHYNIPPPETHPELVVSWNKLLAYKKSKPNHRLARYAEKWKKHCDELTKKKPTYQHFAHSFINDDVNYWLDTPTDIIELTPIEKAALKQIHQQTTTETNQLAISQQLKKYTTLRDTLIARQKMMPVAFSGQLRNPGLLSLRSGTTLKQGVDLSHPTVFAALNRVELHRNGKVYKYSMKIPEHQIEKLYPHDRIFIREQNFWGDGRNTQPSTKTQPLKLTKTTYHWDQKKTYLQTLSKIALLDQDKWFNTYLTLKNKHTWTADFYEDIICYLLDQNAKKLTSKVAQDLAELHPDNPEILRRAARAFFRNGELPTAKRLFQRIAFLTNNAETSLYDLARLHDKQKDYHTAASLYYRALKDNHYRHRNIIYLEEMNACLIKGNINPADLGIDSSLVRHVPLDIKVNLIWDSEQFDIDLIIKNTLIDKHRELTHQQNFNHWIQLSDISHGLGPESASLQKQLPGEYTLTAKFRGDWNDHHKSDTTLTMEVIRNYGAPNETRQSVTRRLHESDQQVLMNLKVAPSHK
ncbi:MAG: VIT domain-containing protein [Akkermansiaceae bacterium]